MKGKEKCNFLKAFRKEIAEKNDIPYTPKECDHIDNCLGTCPLCDEEASYILNKLKEKKQNGESVSAYTELFDEIIKFKSKIDHLTPYTTELVDNEIAQERRHRRLPIFFIIDNQWNDKRLKNRTIDAIKDMISYLCNDPYALETANIAIIQGMNEGKIICPLTELYEFNYEFMEHIEEGEYTDVNKCIENITQYINQHVFTPTFEYKGDWKSIVIFSSSNNVAKVNDKILTEYKKSYVDRTVAIILGDCEIDEYSNLTNNVFNNPIEAIKFATRWRTDTVMMGSISTDEWDDDFMPPVPPEVNIVL